MNFCSFINFSILEKILYSFFNIVDILSFKFSYLNIIKKGVMFANIEFQFCYSLYFYFKNNFRKICITKENI